MKHGRRIWEKRLTSSATHNKSLLLNQASDLIKYGRITTTVPKAKILKHYADKIINIAKAGDELKMRKLVFLPEETIPKLKILAARFGDRKGGYTRLILNGFNRPGSDRAPLATVEYINSPNDSIHYLAQQHLPKVKADLEAIRFRRFNSKSIQLENPFAPGTFVTKVTRTLRSDLNSKQIKQLAVKERSLSYLATKLENSLTSFDGARKREAKYAKRVLTEKEVKWTNLLSKLQEKTNSLDSKSRLAFVSKYNKTQSAVAAKKSTFVERILRVDAADNLSWEKSEAAIRSEAESTAVLLEEKRKTGPVEIKKEDTGEEKSPAHGSLTMLNRVMKFFNKK
ncbi:hypothetical protein HK100_000061 [Physocladia obscura]|uniref:Ribosomal protein L17 n=1 Tax=Physocladia obscura TaxID=109957 RepID=A0AAD5T4W2_9FUNG|nr:hypothetical protein HK100_000061 [Physocladia obscura]